ncbi:MAG: response regulator [Ferrovibrio sp.]|nr:response regulator [Ferrovibrio sp.]
MLKLVDTHLRNLGFSDIDTVDDPLAAITMCRRKPYGLILSDWRMKPIDGLGLLKAVRADERLADVPFVMITAEIERENVQKAKAAGVNGYIAKPFDHAQLKAKLQAILPVGTIL